MYTHSFSPSLIIMCIVDFPSSLLVFIVSYLAYRKVYSGSAPMELSVTVAVFKTYTVQFITRGF
jgi:hypothetical protein